jgi:hypothetical protein
MTKIEVGDKVQLDFTKYRDQYYNVRRDTTYTVKGISNDRMNLFDDSGYQVSSNHADPHSYHIDDFEIVEKGNNNAFSYYKSPILEKTVTTRHIEPGTYGVVEICSVDPLTIMIRDNRKWDVKTLTETANLFNELASFLSESE